LGGANWRQTSAAGVTDIVTLHLNCIAAEAAAVKRPFGLAPLSGEDLAVKIMPFSIFVEIVGHIDDNRVHSFGQ
jgi:hypothetical protein